MAAYITKQRRALLDYFSNHIDEPVCAQQIAAELAGENISLSAVYRNLAALEHDGKLQRISVKDSREVCYRYKAFEECIQRLHLSCKECGRTFHLNDEGAARITDTLYDTADFALDKAETILYGICGKCGKSKRA